LTIWNSKVDKVRGKKMLRIRRRGEDIRKFILDNVEKYPSDISLETAKHFGITRQAVNKHLQKLTTEGALTESGYTRNRIYKLAAISNWEKVYKVSSDLAEDLVWRMDVQEVLGKMPENVLRIWHYGFTEMFNNALDHAGCSAVMVKIVKTAATTEMMITDNGFGIFKKIQTVLNLLDERHAILELSKGKLTTDPKNHSGEGIFFASRMFDSYDILSGGVYFTHKFGQPEDWILENNRFANGTTVWMK
jgi:anti-sigma regulatory factor (Ser/Thr protein kinase)/biotin operon repressor